MKGFISLLRRLEVLNLKPILVSHTSYQNFVLEQLQKHYSGGVLLLVNKDWPVITKLWITDLSYTTKWLHDSYSNKGPAPRDPASMLRAYLLFLMTNPTIGITKWVDQLYRVPLYAIFVVLNLVMYPVLAPFTTFFNGYGPLIFRTLSRISNP